MIIMAMIYWIQIQVRVYYVSLFSVGNIWDILIFFLSNSWGVGCLKCIVSTAEAPVELLTGAIVLQLNRSQPSPSLCDYNPNHENQNEPNTNNVSKSLESEFVYSLIFYWFSLVAKQKIRLVSLLLFAMLLLHHICLNYRLLCLRMEGCKLMIIVRGMKYSREVRDYYVYILVFNRNYLGCINLRCCLKCFVSSFLKINFKN